MLKKLIVLLLLVLPLVSWQPSDNTNLVLTIEAQTLVENGFQNLERFDSAKVVALLKKHDILIDWENELKMIKIIFPEKNNPKDLVTAKQERLMNVLKENYFYKYLINVNNKRINCLLVASKAGFKGGMNDDFFMGLCSIEKAEPMKLLEFYKIMAVVECNFGSNCKFFSDDKMESAFYSHTCSDNVINGKWTCFYDTVKVKMTLKRNGEIKELSRDTVHVTKKD